MTAMASIVMSTPNRLVILLQALKLHFWPDQINPKVRLTSLCIYLLFNSLAWQIQSSTISKILLPILSWASLRYCFHDGHNILHGCRCTILYLCPSAAYPHQIPHVLVSFRYLNPIIKYSPQMGDEIFSILMPIAKNFLRECK